MPRREPRFIDEQVLAELSRLSAGSKHEILKYASFRARMVAEAGQPVAADEPSILVADAITDTLTGVVTWDRRYPFSHHLCGVIRTRTSNQLKRARRRTEVPYDVLGDGDRDGLVACESVGDDRAGARPDVRLENVQIVRKLYGLIWTRAVGDAPLVAVLDAYAFGLSKPREVMSRTGLTRTEFLNTRRRLDRMLVRIPSDLLRAALDSMRGLSLSRRRVLLSAAPARSA
jgi:hypothetical protein